MQAGLLTVLSTEGDIMSSLGLTVYDGKTVIKRNGERKVMRFSSGKLGYFGGGKITLDGKTYQVSCSMVELSSTVASPVTSFTKEQIDAMNAKARETVVDPDDLGGMTDEEIELERQTRPGAAE